MLKILEFSCHCQFASHSPLFIGNLMEITKRKHFFTETLVIGEKRRNYEKIFI